MEKENFLQLLDKKYENTRTNRKISKENEEFAIYQRIEPLDFNCQNEFYCYKKSKTKILYCPDNCKVYLTDQDIINIFLKLNDDMVNKFLEKLVNLYNGNGYKFKFKVINIEFEGVGIDYEVENNDKILLYTDNEITINELIFVINIILEKDRLYNSQEKTLIKYISLLKYYKYNDKNVEKFLKEIQFPLSFKIEKKSYNLKMLKEIDEKFHDKGLIFKKYMII